MKKFFNGKPKKNQSGELLMNILVFAGITALLATIAIPFLKKYQPNLELMTAGRDMASDLRYAQQLTVTGQIAHSFQMNKSAGSYEILKLETPTSTVKTVNLPANISYYAINSLTDDKVMFNSYGGVSESGEIILANIYGKQLKINVKPSGYIQLEQ